MTLKLHNSFSKDPYTKQLWLRFGQLSLILDRLTHNKYRATHYSACLKTSLSWVTQLLTYFVYNVYHPVDKETKGKSIRCWLLIEQECVIGNFFDHAIHINKHWTLLKWSAEVPTIKLPVQRNLAQTLRGQILQFVPLLHSCLAERLCVG